MYTAHDFLKNILDTKQGDFANNAPNMWQKSTNLNPNPRILYSGMEYFLLACM